ncbi:hypothetical protein CcI49_08910 [Frankia sp. CcI49]|uniref:SH3 domain-containing protein n=1 Tax=unclassified Frankia TaxID=2632575 RepID=UPI0006CA217B|nr:MULTISPECIES: SH3 domain-containing protein [unclassified Frankia]KPM50903.1 hypothetical protein ACG83_36045 [Frankia sp. R43]ONH60722.1 hypothetical protein CcI49_08910 [Frankia sp. CcI49]
MRIRSLIAAFGLAAATSVSTVLLPASPALAASCPDNGWGIYDGSTGYFFNTNAVNIRTGPGTGCTAVGQGQTSHYVQYDCYKLGDGGYTWTHLYDSTTGKQGWVRDDLLVGYGSNYHC